MGRDAYNKTTWTKAMDEFLLENHPRMTNQQLANALGLTLTVTRSRCYELGMYRVRLEYWTPEQVEYLKEKYRSIGDSELAEIFDRNWHKDKGWSKKHIAKKRRYLGLKRTPQQIKAIRQRNVDMARFALCPVKAWETRGVAKKETIRTWRLANGDAVKMIKTENGWMKLAHFNWLKAYDTIPEGMIIIHLDGNAMNCDIRNLKAIYRADHLIRNGSSQTMSDAWIAGILTNGKPHLREDIKANKALIELKRNNLLLKRTINKIQS